MKNREDIAFSARVGLKKLFEETGIDEEKKIVSAKRTSLPDQAKGVAQRRSG